MQEVQSSRAQFLSSSLHTPASSLARSTYCTALRSYYDKMEHVGEIFICQRKLVVCCFPQKLSAAISSRAPFSEFAVLLVTKMFIIY